MGNLIAHERITAAIFINRYIETHWEMWTGQTFPEKVEIKSFKLSSFIVELGYREVAKHEYI